MSVTNRWYVLAPAPDGRGVDGCYVIEGWSRTGHLAESRAFKLHGCAVLATNRAQALRYARKQGLRTAAYKRVPVASLFVNCSLRVRNFRSPGWAASDNCGRPATCDVDMPTGQSHWRCAEHQNMRFAKDSPEAEQGRDLFGHSRDKVWRWVTVG